MSAVSIFCFLIALSILGSCLRKGADIFSPGRVYGFIWTLAIGLADLKLSRFQHDWNAFAWITLLIGVLSFYIGVLSVQILYLGKKTHSIQDMRYRLHHEAIRTPRLFFIIIILFIAYVVTYVIEWMHYGVLPLFAKFPAAAREAIPMFGLHLIVNSMPSILFLIFLFFLQARNQPHKKVLLALIFFVVFTASFFFLNRLFYVFFLITALGFAYYASKLVRPRYVIIVVITIIIVLGYMQSFREAHYAESYFYVVSDMRYSASYAAFTGPYMYIVMNLENFARAVGRIEHFSYGYFTFDFLLALTGLKHPLADYFYLDRKVGLISGYNTFPYFWDYYYDFGLIGLAVLPAVLGFGITLLYRKMRQEPTIQFTVFYSIAIFVMVISFFANILSLLNFAFNVILLLIVQFFIARGTPSKGSSR